MTPAVSTWSGAARALGYASLALAFGCSTGSIEPAADEYGEGSLPLTGAQCRTAADCFAPTGPCLPCPGGKGFSCPEAVCVAGECGVQMSACPDEPDAPQCGGIAGLPCPEGMVCVDDPADDCDPARGGADCIGTCVPESCDPTKLCTTVVTCVDGLAYPTGCGPSNCDEPLGPCDGI